MERSVWTDERIDDMASANSAQFERLWTEMRDMRAEMRDMRAEMHAGFEAMRRDMLHGAIALFGSQAALFAVLVVQAL